MKSTSEFNEWFFKTWKNTGGLIQPSVAAQILEIKRQSVNGMIRKHRLIPYKFKNKTFIALKDVALIKAQKE